MTADPTASHAAITSAEHLARDHDENFPVAFALIPRRQRRHLRVIYSVCRTIDDIGDEGPGDATQRLATLDAFATDLDRCWGGVPQHTVLQALQPTVHELGLGPEPFHRLITANRMDQTTARWATFADLLHYCRHSATPVGELVLAVLGVTDARSITLSDQTCIGLQLVNFWQDIRRDFDDNDRVYLPQREMALFGVTEADLAAPVATSAVRDLIALQTDRARSFLEEGAPLAGRVPWRARLDLRMFTAAGLAVCDSIAAQNFDTLAVRPAPGRRGRATVAARVLGHMIRRTR